MSMEVLTRHLEELKARKGYLNSNIGNKIKNGVDTEVKSIIIYVKKKLPCTEMAEEECIPTEIEGVPTDIVELNPTGWVADRTSVSELHPLDQLHRLGLIEAPPRPLAAFPQIITGTPKGFSEWCAWAYPAQNQANCGCCTAFGNTGVWEALIRIAANNIALACKLSEAHLFFCTPGANCADGSTVDAILTQAKKGVCLETCLPYKDVDQACAAGICPNWMQIAYKLAGYTPITNPTAQMLALDAGPLNCTMAVYQSFFNYVSGVYRKQANDPLAGYHDIGNFGYDNIELKADLIRNSWGPGWGTNCMVNGINRPGYCWIAQGQLDPERQQLILGTSPSPTPVPPPVKKKCLLFGWLKGQSLTNAQVSLIRTNLAKGIMETDF